MFTFFYLSNALDTDCNFASACIAGAFLNLLDNFLIIRSGCHNNILTNE